MLVRICKALLVFAVSAYPLLSAYTLLSDPSAMEAVLGQVMSINADADQPPGQAQAVSDPLSLTLGGLVLRGAEALAGLLLFVGALRLLRKCRAPVEVFHAAKGLATLGATLGFLVWFLAILAAGGQCAFLGASGIADPAQDAFRLSVVALLVIIVVLLPDGEIEANKKPRRRSFP